MTTYQDIGVDKTGHVTTIEIRRPPLNFFDVSLINQIADALTEIDNDPEARAVVLAAQGKAFCAGANFGDPTRQEAEARARSGAADNLGPISHLYIEAVNLPRQKADRRRGTRRRHRRRARPRGRGGFSRHLPGGALCRQFHQARVSSRLRPDGDAA